MTPRFLASSPGLGFIVFMTILTLSATASQQGPPQGRGGRGNVELPDGPGKESVQAYCTRCHQLGAIVNSGGYTYDGWQQLISTMVALPPEPTNSTVEYLTTAFPEQPKPKPVLLDGSVRVAFKEWNLPTLGSRPHDPLATGDGANWDTGVVGNNLP